MARKQLRLAILLTLTALCACAFAQDEKNELAGLIGRTFVSDQGIQCGGCVNPFIHTGKGISAEANFSRFLWANPLVAISGEVPLVWAFDQDLNSGEDVVPSGYQALFLTPAVRVNAFPTTAFSPWVSLGGGVGHFIEDHNLVYSGPNPGHNTTTGVLEAGLGLDVRVWRQYSVRGQVRDFWAGTPDYPLATTGKSRQHNYFVGVGVIWHF